jgi:hypothetical protein
MTHFFLVPDHQTAPLLQVTNASLYRISVAVSLVVTGRRASGPLSEVFAGRDRRLDSSVGEPAADPGGIVTAVASDCLGALPRSSSGPRDRYLVHQVGEEGRLVALTSRQDRSQREALPIRQQMDLG